MRNTYVVTYRGPNGRIKAQELSADTYFDAAVAVRLAHHVRYSDIISNVIKELGRVHRIGNNAFVMAR